MATFSNFQLATAQGLRKNTVFATVDVTTGFWFWKKTVRKEICKDYTNSWFFLDTGNSTPGMEVEKLERVFYAKRRRASI